MIIPKSYFWHFCPDHILCYDIHNKGVLIQTHDKVGSYTRDMYIWDETLLFESPHSELQECHLKNTRVLKITSFHYNDRTQTSKIR